MGKIRVAVLFGGVSSEHEVSLNSAKSVIENIPEDRFDVIKIGITKQGEWMLYSGPASRLPDGSWQNEPSNLSAFLSPDTAVHGLVAIDADGLAHIIPVDVVFPVLHGANGEDGTVQGLLTLAGISFVGSGVTASAVCMDKAVTKSILEANGINQAKWDFVSIRDYRENPDLVLDRVAGRLGYPVFVKPANAGSSVGISKAADREALKKAIELAAEHDRKIVFEESVDGMELECAVLGNSLPQVSVCGEIVPCNEFYDYEAKYIAGDSRLNIPAPLPQSKADEIRETAARVYTLLGCEGMTRMDFFLRKKDGAVLLNEPNTIPGFTSISMYPKLFEATGLAYSELLSSLIKLAMER